LIRNLVTLEIRLMVL